MLQQGLSPTDWKPIPTVGDGVFELRIRAGGSFRVFYVTTPAEGIVALHTFIPFSSEVRMAASQRNVGEGPFGGQ